MLTPEQQQLTADLTALELGGTVYMSPERLEKLDHYAPDWVEIRALPLDARGQALSSAFARPQQYAVRMRDTREDKH